MTERAFNHPNFGALKNTARGDGLSNIFLFYVIQELSNHLDGYRVDQDGGIQSGDYAGVLYHERNFSGMYENNKIHGSIRETADSSKPLGKDMLCQYVARIRLEIEKGDSRASADICSQHFYEDARAGLSIDLLGPPEPLLKLGKFLMNLFGDAKKKFDAEIGNTPLIEK